MADRGDVESELREFAEGRYLALRRTAYLLCGDWHQAEDLVQCALAKVIVAARRRRVDSLDAYARQVLVRQFFDEGGRAWRRREKSWADLDVEPVGVQDDSETRLVVLAALGALPARQRAAVVLRYWEDRSIEETAAALGVSAGTVKSQCFKALAALRIALGEDLLGIGIGSEGT